MEFDAVEICRILYQFFSLSPLLWLFTKTKEWETDVEDGILLLALLLSLLIYIPLIGQSIYCGWFKETLTARDCTLAIWILGLKLALIKY